MLLSLYPMSLAAHVADLHRALEDTPKEWPREALTLLKGDPIAQIMSFVPFRSERRSLSAVSPQMRLDSEVIAGAGHLWRVEPRVQVSALSCDSSSAVSNRELLFRFVTDSKEFDRQQMMLSLWWASRCGLPVELFIDSNDNELLALLGDALRSRVKKLAVKIRSPLILAADNATISSSISRATVLTSLRSSPHVQSLSITNYEQQADSPMSAEVMEALETAASLPVVALELTRWMALHNLSTLAGNCFLRSLRVNHSGLRSLEGLSNYPMLETLMIANCPHLTSVSALAGLQRLEAVTVSRCDLHSLDGLDRCVALRSANMYGNRNLQSLSPLASAPLLETIVASYCDIRSVQGLGSCVALTEITLNGNKNLQSLSDLSNAPWLQTVQAYGCGLRGYGVSGRWPALRKIEVGGNRDLQSLSGLSGAPLLLTIIAWRCDIRSVQDLGSCAALTEIIVNDNGNLQSLSDLSRAPCLHKILATGCALRDLGESGTWSALREIDVSGNDNLQSLSGLAGAPLLETVRAAGCCIQDFTVLETCPNLSKVFKTETRLLERRVDGRMVVTVQARNGS